MILHSSLLLGLAQEGDAPALSGRASRSVGTFFGGGGGVLCAGQEPVTRPGMRGRGREPDGEGP